ncbi:MAG: hypothetical protein H7066_12070 [Cytophagaceae bacterium]|nr:hypothetical protein [Gemmatimonadaceae bacterium]
MIRMHRRGLGAALTVLALGACVDSPDSLAATAESGDPLALTFDELARQAAASGDMNRAEGFTYAAIAARNGIAPTRLEVRMGATFEIYEAFVSAISWQVPGAAAIRVPAHRTITAWRRTSDAVTRILTLTTPSDSAPVLNPLSLSASGPIAAAFAGASAFYHESATIGNSNLSNTPDAFWMATTGWVQIRETLTGAACPRPESANKITGVSCQQARFAVRFDVTMLPVVTRPYNLRLAGETRRFQVVNEQSLSGYKLSFACATVNASTGC